MSNRVKSYVSLALFARETALRYRNLKRKYPEPKHAEFLEQEARASYRRAMLWVIRARLAHCKATVATIINLGATQQAAQRAALMGAPMGTA